MHSRWVATTLVAAIALSAAPAHADDRERATTLLRQGSEQFAARDFAGALRSFDEAYRAYSNPKILFDIGRAAEEDRDPVAAANAFQAFLDQIEDAPEVHAQLLFAHDHLEARKAGLGWVVVRGAPPLAVITVDGRRAFGASAYVAPGQHELTIDASGFRPVTLQFDVRAAEQRTLTVALEKLVPPTPPLVEPRQPLVAKAPPPAAGAHRAKTAGWTLIGTGAAALAASGVFGVLASSNSARLGALVDGKSADARPADADGLRAAVKTDAWVSTATLGAGIASAAVGAYLLLSHRSPAATPAADARGNPALSFRF